MVRIDCPRPLDLSPCLQLQTKATTQNQNASSKNFKLNCQLQRSDSELLSSGPHHLEQFTSLRQLWMRRASRGGECVMFTACSIFGWHASYVTLVGLVAAFDVLKRSCIQPMYTDSGVRLLQLYCLHVCVWICTHIHFNAHRICMLRVLSPKHDAHLKVSAAPCTYST